MGAHLLTDLAGAWTAFGVEWRAQKDWMAVNAVLAVAPAAGAAILHRWRHRFGLLRWVPLACVGLLLPNAPYVLTDLIHLRPAVEYAPSRAAVLCGVIPLFVMLLGVGVASYGYCIHILRREMFDRGWTTAKRLVAEGLVDLVCAVGVVLGRIPRLNSWDVLRPVSVARGLGTLVSDPRSIGLALGVVLASSLGVDLLALIAGHTSSRSRGRAAR